MIFSLHKPITCLKYSKKSFIPVSVKITIITAANLYQEWVLIDNKNLSKNKSYTVHKIIDLEKSALWKAVKLPFIQMIDTI